LKDCDSINSTELFSLGVTELSSNENESWHSFNLALDLSTRHIHSSINAQEITDIYNLIRRSSIINKMFHPPKFPAFPITICSPNKLIEEDAGQYFSPSMVSICGLHIQQSFLLPYFRTNQWVIPDLTNQGPC
jgi:hypothetical protein